MNAVESQSDAGQTVATKLRVTVLAGGPSAEREVSLDSGRAVADALRGRGHDVTLADISPTDLAALDQVADVVFPALHGTFGEDGQVQRLLAQRGLAFVGSGEAASALAIDKARTKQVAIGQGVNTPAFAVVTSTDDKRLAELPESCAVKPVREGSSVDITLASSAAERDAAIAAVAAKYGDALVETLVTGREITVGILGGKALPPIWIRPAQGFYDYRAKYQASDTVYEFRTGLSAATVERMSAASVRTFEAIGCRHLARVDWIVDDAERAWLLEVNTMPGFTSHSLLPKAAAKVGIAFDELTERLVRMAMEDKQ